MKKEKIIKKVLMCEPKYFEVNYAINPWMKIGSVDKKRAYKQWLELLGIYGKLGIKVDIIEQKENLPDMVFAADQGLFYRKNILLSNFRYPQRREEKKYYKQWFEKNDFKIETLPERVFFEGGDSVWFGDKLLVGVGFRGNLEGVRGIGEIWGIRGIPLGLINPYFFHLDMCLFVLNKETIIYYPEAFSEVSRKKLKKLVPNLIPLEKKEAFNFAANSLVTDHHAVIQEGNRGVKKEIEGQGYLIIETDVSEFMKAGGGIHCLTGVIEEDQ